MPDIAGTVAAMTECEPDAVGEKACTASLVDRDSATRWQGVWRLSLSSRALLHFEKRS